MGTASKHFYRFTYLRSEHWQNLRIAKLAEKDARCARCNVRDLSNDVHHLRYRKLFDVQLSDLVVVCRMCHDLVHVALERYREKIKSSEDVWRATLNAAALVHKNIDHEHNAKFRELRLQKQKGDLPKETARPASKYTAC